MRRIGMISGRRLQRTRAWGWLLATAATGSACTETGADPATVRDSAGVTIVESRAPVASGSSFISVDSVPAVDITGVGDGRAGFGSGILVTSMPGGPIVVADRRELLWFDLSGRLIRSSGREGSGPGEFRQIDLLQAFGDSVLVYDLALRRVSVFDASGNLGRVTRIVGADSGGAAFPLGVLGDGRLVLGTYPEPREPGLRRDSVTLRVGSPTGAFNALVGRFPWVDQIIELRAEGVAMRRVVFAREAFWATFETDIVVATNERFAFDWFDADGRWLRSVRRRWTPTPVTDDEVRAQIEEWLETFPAGMEERKARARATFGSGPRPSEKPPYGGIVVSDSGDVWVLEYDEPGQRRRPATYSVFARSGQWRAQVVVPAGVEPRVIGANHLIATWRDADDAVHLRIYPIRHQ